MFLSGGRKVNKEYYLEIMCHLREVIRRKCTDLWKNNSPLLHHDNALIHASLFARNFLAKNNTVIMPQPPYSLDSPSYYFFLFPKLKGPMQGRRFATIEKIKAASLKESKAIQNNPYHKCSKYWKKNAVTSALYLTGISLKGTIQKN